MKATILSVILAALVGFSVSAQESPFSLTLNSGEGLYDGLSRIGCNPDQMSAVMGYNNLTVGDLRKLYRPIEVDLAACKEEPDEATVAKTQDALREDFKVTLKLREAQLAPASTLNAVNDDGRWQALLSASSASEKALQQEIGRLKLQLAEMSKQLHRGGWIPYILGGLVIMLTIVCSVSLRRNFFLQNKMREATAMIKQLEKRYAELTDALRASISFDRVIIVEQNGSVYNFNFQGAERQRNGEGFSGLYGCGCAECNVRGISIPENDEGEPTTMDKLRRHLEKISTPPQHANRSNRQLVGSVR
jgi:hypothetical protein